jgi:hypothetical protein
MVGVKCKTPKYRSHCKAAFFAQQNRDSIGNSFLFALLLVSFLNALTEKAHGGY